MSEIGTLHVKLDLALANEAPSMNEREELAKVLARRIGPWVRQVYLAELHNRAQPDHVV